LLGNWARGILRCSFAMGTRRIAAARPRPYAYIITSIMCSFPMEMDYCCPEEKLRPATRRESVVRPISDAVDARARHEMPPGHGSPPRLASPARRTRSVVVAGAWAWGVGHLRLEKNRRKAGDLLVPSSNVQCSPAIKACMQA
jgi:hypothetical protein